MPIEVVTIDLLGTSFAVQTDESREYLLALVSELERRLASLRTATRVGDPLKLSILASVTILDELARARRHAGEGEEFARLAERLIGRLDEGLSEPAAGGEPRPAVDQRDGRVLE